MVYYDLVGEINSLIRKVLCWFLVDKIGIVEQLEMKLLKPKKGSGTELEDSQAHCQISVW